MLAGKTLKQVVGESIQLSGLVIGAIEGVGEPALAELASKYPSVAALEPLVVGALNPTMEGILKPKLDAIQASLLA